MKKSLIVISLLLFMPYYSIVAYDACEGNRAYAFVKAKDADECHNACVTVGLREIHVDGRDANIEFRYNNSFFDPNKRTFYGPSCESCKCWN